MLSASFYDSRIAWYENVDGRGSFGPRQIISLDTFAAMSVIASDLDGDGDQDVLAASLGKVTWHQNTNGQGAFSWARTITTNAIGATSVFAADVDGDGDQDVLSASQDDDKIAWYENVDGNGNFGPQRVITTQAEFARSVHAADLDGDGDLDVLAAEDYDWDPRFGWYENLDGLGTFGPKKLLGWGCGADRCVIADDMDGDGDLDVIAGLGIYERLAWYDNTDGAGAFGAARTISTLAEDAWSVISADLDGDGDRDVLSASIQDDMIAWYPNEDGRGTFESQRVITTLAERARSVFAADLDGDGDVDVMSASEGDDEIAWYENLDGQGTFGPPRIITTLVQWARSVFAADLDGDGDLDALSTSAFDWKLAWYENTDGLGTFGPQSVITTQIEYVGAIYAADLDGDGDQDVLAGGDDEIAWCENTDGSGTFSSPVFISPPGDGAASVIAADLDGDGDQDVLSASSGKIVWYENTDGLGTFGPQQVITNLATRASCVFAADLDGDGDQDVLSTSAGALYVLPLVAWYENVDGTGMFGPQKVISDQANYAASVFAADPDGDGDQDVLSASAEDNKVAWYENDPARAGFRTDSAGVNPTAFVASSPVLGREWTATVDNEGTGSLAAWVAGYQDPAEVFLPLAGEYLLIDPNSAGGELLGLPPAFGAGSVVFTTAIPLDTLLVGVTLSTQGMGFGGPGGTNLHNAYDLRLAY